MRKQLYKLPAFVVGLGMLSTAIIVFAQGNLEVGETVPLCEVVEVEVKVIPEVEVLTEAPAQEVETETLKESVASNQ